MFIEADRAIAIRDLIKEVPEIPEICANNSGCLIESSEEQHTKDWGGTTRLEAVQLSEADRDIITKTENEDGKGLTLFVSLNWNQTKTGKDWQDQLVTGGIIGILDRDWAGGPSITPEAKDIWKPR